MGRWRWWSSSLQQSPSWVGHVCDRGNDLCLPKAFQGMLEVMVDTFELTRIGPSREKVQKETGKVGSWTQRISNDPRPRLGCAY